MAKVSPENTPPEYSYHQSYETQIFSPCHKTLKSFIYPLPSISQATARSSTLCLKHDSLSAAVRSAFVHFSWNSHPCIYLILLHAAKWILNKCLNEWLCDLYFHITDTKHGEMNKFIADDATDTNCLRLWLYNWEVCLLSTINFSCCYGKCCMISVPPDFLSIYVHKKMYGFVNLIDRQIIYKYL